MNNLSLLLKKPVITEKSMDSTKEGKYTFLVDLNATKKEIKKAIEDQFKVNVISINTVILKGKKRKVGRRRTEIYSSPKKKAIVKLLPEQKIEAFGMGGK